MVTRRVSVVALAAGLVLAGCGDDDESSTGTTSPSTAADVTTGDADDDSPALGAGSGRCAVTITGDVSAEWESDAGGFQAFVYGGWLANPSAEDEAAFGLNCYDSDFNIVGFLAAPGTTIPMEPATYAVDESGSSGAPIAADVALLFDEGFWETTGGTLEITEFDDSHVRGTFTVSITDSSDETRTAEVTGNFAHSR